MTRRLWTFHAITLIASLGLQKRSVAQRQEAGHHVVPLHDPETARHSSGTALARRANLRRARHLSAFVHHLGAFRAG